MADEPFLEAALDDRSRDVRAAAAELLSRLPESRLVARMVERARSHVRLLPALFGEPRIEASLPAASPDLARDGVEARQGRGAGESRLVQVLGAVPPSFWEREWERDAARILRMAQGNESETALLDGWARAAQRQVDARWAGLLLDRRVELARTPMPASDPGWSEVLPQPRLHAAVARLLRLEEERPSGGARDASGKGAFAPVLLEQCRPPWSEELARAVLERVRQGRFEYGGLASLAGSVPLSLCEEALEGWPENLPEWQNYQVRAFQDLLRFRCEMLRELSA